MANASGVIFGADVSHHQNSLPPLALSSLSFLIARTAQANGGKYGTTKDKMYGTHKAAAIRAGVLFSAYFYIGVGLTPQQNVDLHASIEPDRSIPVMLDWEEGSGDGAFLRAVHRAFVAAGYRVWGSYAPNWYWKAQGQPNLAGLPPIVSSRYPNMVPGPLASEWAETPESFWSGYGGNTVLMIQFTSSGRINGYNGNLDLNAFRGTRAQLAQLWYGAGQPVVEPEHEGDDEVSLIATIDMIASGDKRTEYLRELPGGKNARLVIRVPEMDWTTHAGAATVWLGNVMVFGSGNGGLPGTDPYFQEPTGDKAVDYDRVIPIPDALYGSLDYSCNLPWKLEIWG
jgi:hypothetical protein